MAPRGTRGGRLGSGALGWLRLPDRDHLPRQPRRRARRGGAHRVHGPTRGRRARCPGASSGRRSGSCSNCAGTSSAAGARPRAWSGPPPPAPDGASGRPDEPIARSPARHPVVIDLRLLQEPAAGAHHRGLPPVAAGRLRGRAAAGRGARRRPAPASGPIPTRTWRRPVCGSPVAGGCCRPHVPALAGPARRCAAAAWRGGRASGPPTRRPPASCSTPPAARRPRARQCRSWRPCSTWHPGSCPSATLGPPPRGWATGHESLACVGPAASWSPRGPPRTRRCVSLGWIPSGSRSCPWPLTTRSVPGPPRCRRGSSACWAAYRIPERYLVVGGRYDARSDLPTLLAALRSLRDARRPRRSTCRASCWSARRATTRRPGRG